MKSVKMFGKSVPLLAIVMVSVLAIGASAALLDYYGRIVSMVTVNPAITLDGKSYPDSMFTDTISGFGGDLVTGTKHWLRNLAEENIEVELVTGSYDEAIDEIYPEYKLDAILDDDLLRVALKSDITWAEFQSISFDYLIEEDTWESLPENLLVTGPWIPQINIALRDPVTGEVTFGLAWHSFRTGITGTVGERASMTYDKDDFYIYDVKFDLIPGISMLWSEVLAQEIGEIITAVNPLTFSYFVQNAGDTSVDPNKPDYDPPQVPPTNPYWPSKSSQIVWISNYVTQRDIEGIIVIPMGTYTASWVYEPGQMETIEFRMVYELNPAGILVNEKVVTEVVPLGFP